MCWFELTTATCESCGYTVTAEAAGNDTDWEDFE